jgi:hypothetical protein
MLKNTVQDLEIFSDTGIIVASCKMGMANLGTEANSGTYTYWLTLYGFLSILSLDNSVVHKFFSVRFLFCYDFMCPHQIMRSIITWRKTTTRTRNIGYTVTYFEL